MMHCIRGDLSLIIHIRHGIIIIEVAIYYTNNIPAGKVIIDTALSRCLVFLRCFFTPFLFQP